MASLHLVHLGISEMRIRVYALVAATLRLGATSMAGAQDVGNLAPAIWQSFRL
jgi:hypothetical protein